MRKTTIFLALAGAALLIVSFVPWPAAGREGAALPAAAAPDPAADGAALFRAKGCASCHRHAAVDGASANVGPELTAYDADPVFLRRWLSDPAAVRPNTLMPNLGLDSAEIDALIAFLESEPGPTDRGK